MNLNGKWKLYFAEEGKYKINGIYDLKTSGLPCIDCTVPGNVELDLSDAGLLPKDLFKGENIIKAENFELYEWWYETEFTAPSSCPEDKEMILNFRAVDCFAEYYLNGAYIGSSDNMFIANEFDITDKLAYGKVNTLHVHIHSALVKGACFDAEPNECYFSWGKTTLHHNVRKAPHSYGWDIMPRAISAGIWRDVTLECRDKYRFKYLLFHLNKINGDDGIVHIMYDSVVPQQYLFKRVILNIKGKCGDSQFEQKCYGHSSGKVAFTIKNIKLWWPKPYGEPNVYDLQITLTDLDSNEITSTTIRQGFRTLSLDRTDIIEENGKFEFIVNGEKILLNGSNWVPMDVYHSRDKSRYQKALELADDIGCNVLRCWGGNVYEDHEFFDFCDDHGILVWQDFAMACNYYPQTEEFLKAIQKEAEWVVKEYRHHCCIAVWSGDNEIDSLVNAFGIDPAVNRITREVLPRVVERLDPLRPYIASSPYISPLAFKLGYESHPEEHLWGPRDYYKSNFYSKSKAYFVSETGYHGCPSKESIEKFIDADKVWPYANNSQWTLHSSDQSGNASRVWLMHNQVEQLFGKVPTDINEYVLASQISQAEAKKYFIERIRGKMDYYGGVIWWNLIDGWPQMSDAVVDYYYNKKLAYDYIKRSSRDFIIMLGETNNWGNEIICANSSLNTVKGNCTIIDLSTDKEIFSTEFSASPNANTKLGKLNIMYSKQTMLLIKWKLEDSTEHFNTYLCGTPGFNFEQYKDWLNKINSL
ncbi:MAG: hypothetical protein U0M42_02630 [Acutalibacteraceae bacterium]|nr:hypothetical protein [Acutalibacteraceae bacterium]